MREHLDGQQRHWEQVFAKVPDLFGGDASDAAGVAAEVFRREGVERILELGGGQGRDTIFFAREGFRVVTLDYSMEAVRTITEKAAEEGLSDLVLASRHDLREPLPFADGTFDACFSHMLYCMAFTSREITSLAAEVRRVLRPGGLEIYTVRHTGDPGYRFGPHRGEEIYERDGFLVHYFDRSGVEELACGGDLIDVEEIEEGALPRRLFQVTVRKR